MQAGVRELGYVARWGKVRRAEQSRAEQDRVLVGRLVGWLIGHHGGWEDGCSESAALCDVVTWACAGEGTTREAGLGGNVTFSASIALDSQAR